MDGIALAREARRLQPDLNVMILTGRVVALQDSELRAAGVRRALEKPVSLEVLTRAIAEVLGHDFDEPETVGPGSLPTRL